MPVAVVDATGATVVVATNDDVIAALNAAIGAMDADILTKLDSVIVAVDHPIDVLVKLDSVITAIGLVQTAVALVNTNMLAAVKKAANAAITTPATSTASATLLAASTRLGCVIFNDAPATLFVKYGVTASATSYTHRIDPGEQLTISEYIGRIDGILESDTGTARVTELTA